MDMYVSQFYLAKVSGNPERYLGEHVVKDLTRSLVGRNYTIYCDNCFTSEKLFQDLLKESIYACGTLGQRGWETQWNSKFQTSHNKGIGERGNHKKVQNGGLVFSLCQDNKLVSVVLPTVHKGLGQYKGNKRMGQRLQYPVLPILYSITSTWEGSIEVTNYGNTTMYQ